MKEMIIETKEYEIYAGIGNSDDHVKLIETVEFDSDLEARNYAELCAYGIYNLNPKRDIFEIMEQDEVDQAVAMEIFKREMKESVVFFALEYNDNEDGSRTMIRHY